MNLDELIQARPRLQPAREGGRMSLAVDERVLRRLGTMVEPSMATLETGAGVSTLVFALAGCRHTAIAPNPQLMENIRGFCGEHSIGDGGLELIAETSEACLPRLAPTPLDVVLIDGRHGFPAPFIDYFYTQSRLKEGGRLIVDDTQLWTGRVLRDFLSEEPGWEREASIGRTAFFRKGEGARPRAEWIDQPYVARQSQMPGSNRLRELLARFLGK